MKGQTLIRVGVFCVAIAFSMALQAEPVWIDVRSQLEYSMDHIDGDIRISHDDIVEEVKRRFPDKSTAIRLYCASGGRSAIAEAALEKAGYENVSNEGGIEDAREARGLGE